MHKKSNNLIFTGGFNPLQNNLIFEGNFYMKEAIQTGVPKENIYVTQPVKNTLEEVYEINKLLKNKIDIKEPKVLLVTSAFHMSRASNIFKKNGTKVIEFPVDFKSKDISFRFFLNPLNWIPNSSELSFSSIAIREIIGRIIYNNLNLSKIYCMFFCQKFSYKYFEPTFYFYREVSDKS